MTGSKGDDVSDLDGYGMIKVVERIRREWMVLQLELCREMNDGTIAAMKDFLECGGQEVENEVSWAVFLLLFFYLYSC